MGLMAELPTGTVTFLLTDIENSTAHWEDAPTEMREALAVHDRIANETIEAHHGVMVKHSGDGCWGVFTAATDAAAAAIEIQRQVQSQPPRIRARLRIRIGMHTGEANPTGEHYFGSTPNRVARIGDIGNGDQIFCSSATAVLLPTADLTSAGLHELRGIGVEEIFVLRHDDIYTDDRPIRRPAFKSSLPKLYTAFVGRHDELEQTREALRQKHSVVTLLGPGGVGKTRLAIETATAIVERTDQPVVFCDLSAVRDSAQLLVTIADAVGARLQPGMDMADSIVDFLRDRTLLVVLDNCEQIWSPVRMLIESLSTLDGIDVLATSRVALRMPGERVLDIAPLTPAISGVDLFVSRAREHDSTFVLEEADEPHVRAIAERLEGIPLAIELAAARIRVMSPVELATALVESFEVLGGSGDRLRDSLEDVVSWSYELLSPAEAAVFERMSVFANGATLDAIRAVCADDDLVDAHAVADIVLSLVEQSMLVAWTADGHRRFRLLETMRAFGHDRLVEQASLGTFDRAHAEYFHSLAAREHGRIFSPDEYDAWRVLDLEWDNLRRGFDTFHRLALYEEAAGLVRELVYYATFSMRLELFSWAEEIRVLPEVRSQPVYGDLCGAAALGAYLRVSPAVLDLAAEGMAADPPDPEGWCRVALAAVFLNNLHAAEEADEMTRSWIESEPESVGTRIWAHGFRAFYLCSHGMPVEAEKHAAITREIARETQSVSAHALAAWAQGMVVSFGNLGGAISIWEDARSGPRSMPRDHLLEHLLVGLVLHFTVIQADPVDALKSCRSALQRAVDSHYYAGTSHLFGVTAIALCRGGEPEVAARLVGAMEANGHLPRGNAQEALTEALGDAAERHKAKGHTMSITQAAHVALDSLEIAITRQSA